MKKEAKTAFKAPWLPLNFFEISYLDDLVRQVFMGIRLKM